jgi:hypothetical protein
LALRLTLGLFLLQWVVEKFVMPQSTAAVWGHYYGFDVSRTLGYLFGAVEVAIAGCLFLGVFRTVAYGAALALHTVSVLVSCASGEIKRTPARAHSSTRSGAVAVRKLGTTWEQLRPNTGENGGLGPTSKQDEPTT